MPVQTLILIVWSVALSSLAQILLKLGVSSASVRLSLATGSQIDRLRAFSLSPWIIAGMALYGLGALLWLNVLVKTEVSQAYPFMGLGFVITAALGFLVFHDTFGVARLVGTLFVIAGICLIARG
jgi:drug/metabolite transporter (DMT)-like permease